MGNKGTAVQSLFPRAGGHSLGGVLCPQGQGRFKEHFCLEGLKTGFGKEGQTGDQFTWSEPRPGTGEEIGW
jgi:hypothetical protein